MQDAQENPQPTGCNIIPTIYCVFCGHPSRSKFWYAPYLAGPNLSPTAVNPSVLANCGAV
jgi:hypothetical protein